MIITFAAATLAYGAPAYAQVVAKVVAVSENASLKRGNKRYKVTRNFALESGDTIRTDKKGQVQIVFVDRTRVLIGPSSNFQVEDVQVSSTKKASKFAVRALGGSFRFLSGDSKKEVYQIKTPSVTMGIRGTEFDFVTSRRRTRVVAFSGEVELCNRRSRCERITGGCDLTSADRTRFQSPKDQKERLDLLAREFPLIGQQARFRSDFRVPTSSCGDVEQAIKAVKAEPVRKTRDVDEDREIRGEGGGYSESADER